MNQLRDPQVTDLVLLETRMLHWRLDTDFDQLRNPKALSQWPAGEQESWRKLWSDVDSLLKQARARMTVITLKGTLTETQRAQVHEVRLEGGKTCVIGMHGREFHCRLKVSDPTGKLLAANDASGDSLDAQIVFAPTADAVFPIEATAVEERGLGDYTLTVRTLATKDTSE